MRAGVLRFCLAASGAGLALWAAFACQAALTERPLDIVASRIAAGESFRAESLQSLEPQLRAASDAAAPDARLLRDAAIVRLREAELEVEAGRPIGRSPQFAAAETALRAALRAAPTDAFLWFGLAWLGKTRDGFTPSLVPYLRLSYDMGEHEGWIAVHRNPFVLAMLPLLPGDLQARAALEFRHLVETEPYIETAAAILAKPGWDQRDALLASIAGVPEANRRQLAKALEGLGVAVQVPGLQSAPAHPWP